ncbi:hypothetical protein B4U84_11840, partial [Westiellopsis prolifica IICB1]
NTVRIRQIDWHLNPVETRYIASLHIQNYDEKFLTEPYCVSTHLSLITKIVSSIEKMKAFAKNVRIFLMNIPTYIIKIKAFELKF